MPLSAVDSKRRGSLIPQSALRTGRKGASLLMALVFGSLAFMTALPAQGQAASEEAACVGEGPLLDLIREEQGLLDERQERLDQEEAVLDIAKARLEADMEQLLALKREVEALLALVEEKHERDVDRLVTLYGRMRPKEAAAIISQMDLGSAVAIFGEMPERQAGPILAKVEPQKAQAISRVILDRNRLPADRQLPDIR